MFARIAAGVWGALIVAGAVIGAVGPDGWREALAHGGPGCPFLRFTGVPCPFCGMTRATLAMGGGDFGDALGYHPLAPVVVIGVLALLAIIAFGRGERLMIGRRPQWILGSVLAVWAVRLVIDYA